MDKKAPHLEDALRDVTVGANSAVVLKCRVSGVPTPEVTFYLKIPLKET